MNSTDVGCDRLRLSIDTLISEIRMRDPNTMAEYEERHAYRRDGALDPVKFTAIVRLSRQLNQHLSALPRQVPSIPLPGAAVLRSPAQQPLFYDKMVRVARGLPAGLQLDVVMPAADTRVRYNPDDFLVYLQISIERLGGKLPSRFLPPMLDGMAVPKHLSRTEMQRLLADHADALLLRAHASSTASTEVRSAARSYYDNVFEALTKHAYLDDPESGHLTLYGRMPFLQHVSVSLRGSLRRAWVDLMGEEVSRNYRVTRVQRDLGVPFDESVAEAPKTGGALAARLTSVLGDARGKVLFCLAHLVCRYIAECEGDHNDEVLREMVFRPPPSVRSSDSLEAFLTPEHMRVVRLTGIGSLLEQAWPLLDTRQREQFRDALTRQVTAHISMDVARGRATDMSVAEPLPPIPVSPTSSAQTASSLPYSSGPTSSAQSASSSPYSSSPYSSGPTSSAQSGSSSPYSSGPTSSAQSASSAPQPTAPPQAESAKPDRRAFLSKVPSRYLSVNL